MTAPTDRHAPEEGRRRERAPSTQASPRPVAGRRIRHDRSPQASLCGRSKARPTRKTAGRSFPKGELPRRLPKAFCRRPLRHATDDNRRRRRQVGTWSCAWPCGGWVSGTNIVWRAPAVHALGCNPFTRCHGRSVRSAAVWKTLMVAVAGMRGLLHHDLPRSHVVRRFGAGSPAEEAPGLQWIDRSPSRSTRPRSGASSRLARSRRGRVGRLICWHAPDSKGRRRAGHVEPRWRRTSSRSVPLARRDQGGNTYQRDRAADVVSQRRDRDCGDCTIARVEPEGECLASCATTGARSPALVLRAGSGQGTPPFPSLDLIRPKGCSTACQSIRIGGSCGM